MDLTARTLPRKSQAQCVNCGVRAQTVCAALGDPQLEEVEAYKLRDQSIPAGSDLFLQDEQNDHLYTVQNGWIMLYTLLKDGRRQINEFCMAGAFIGCQSDLTGPMAYSAQALTDVTVCVLPRAGIDALFRRMPEMAVRFACIAAKSQENAFATLASVGRGSARERVAHLLADLESRSQEHRSNAQGPLPLPLTQEHIGDALGLTSVHVSRTLKGLREDNIVSVQGRSLQVLDRQALFEIAGMAPVAAPSRPTE